MARDFYQQFDFTRTKPIKEDACSYLTPATHLLELRREKADVEKALVAQKEEFQMKMDTLKLRQEDIENREYDLRKKMEGYDPFVLENESKNARAVKKAEDERKMITNKDREISRLNDEVEMMGSKKSELLKKLHAHRMFNAYMSQVLDATDDFHEARDVIARHRTLAATHKDLIATEQHDREILDQQKQELTKYVEDKDDELMKCNMKVAELQHNLDQAKSRTVACDYEWTDRNSELSHRALMIGRMIMAASNLYYLLKTFGIKEPDDIELTTPIEQLEKVRLFIEDMTQILSAETRQATTSVKSSVNRRQ